MKLTIEPRKINKKSEINALRREGFIPAVLYVKGKEGETLTLKNDEFKAHLRQIKSGHLPTSIFSLVDSKGRTRRALIKDIQYFVTTYEVMHLDFEELVDGQPISVNIPIECVGMAECVGVKLGGVVRQVIRHVKVRCLPKDIPTYLELDVREMGLKQSKRLEDIKIPNAVRPLANLQEVVAVIVKR
ncbi:MAG: 50S ribosomal protein L25/general stress protein Ctc [Parachlamydiaceae bacterium]|nr:50S ribosomal protein L25/general stress protein Ctc [Parachlamydiaceae bacterium]